MNKIDHFLTEMAIRTPGVKNGQFRMAAAVVYRNQIIATGVNQMKTHPLMIHPAYRKDQTFLHAEVDAIRNALRTISQEQLARCELRIVRVKRPYNASKTWIHGLAKPCPGCARVIANFGIEKVRWTEDPELAKHGVDLCC